MYQLQKLRWPRSTKPNNKWYEIIIHKKIRNTIANKLWLWFVVGFPICRCVLHFRATVKTLSSYNTTTSLLFSTTPETLLTLVILSWPHTVEYKHALSSIRLLMGPSFIECTINSEGRGLLTLQIKKSHFLTTVMDIRSSFNIVLEIQQTSLQLKPNP